MHIIFFDTSETRDALELSALEEDGDKENAAVSEID